MNWRNKTFVSFLTTLGFLTMSITGIVIFFVPQGQIAFWIDWRFLRLSKSDWGDIHIATSLFFIIAGLFHIYFNWKVLLSYIREKSTGLIKSIPEMTVSLLITLFILAGAIFKIPPIAQLIQLSNFFHEKHWVKSPDHKPPIGHAEQMTLKKFSGKMDMNLKEAVSSLREKGWKGVNPDLTLEEIAVKNETSPLELYRAIKGKQNRKRGEK